MIERIKAFLNNSVVWLLALLAGIAFFWRRSRILEDELKEEKANEAVKEDGKRVAQADSVASDAVSEFDRISREYETQHPDD